MLAQASEAYRGSEAFMSQAENNYVRIKREVEQALTESSSLWAIQAIAVVAAQSLKWNYTGPTGVTAWLATSGGSSQAQKRSEDSYKRLTNELLTLVKLGRDTLEREGGVDDEHFVLAGQIALDAMGVFDDNGKPAPVYVLDFFSGEKAGLWHAPDDPGVLGRGRARL